jgi:hypothetical protein
MAIMTRHTFCDTSSDAPSPAVSMPAALFTCVRAGACVRACVRVCVSVLPAIGTSGAEGK